MMDVVTMPAGPTIHTINGMCSHIAIVSADMMWVYLCLLSKRVWAVPIRPEARGLVLEGDCCSDKERRTRLILSVLAPAALDKAR